MKSCKDNLNKLLYQCQHCEYSTPLQYNLVRHVECNHQKPFPCKTCSKSFDNEEQLGRHQKHHEALQYCCPHCDKNFKDLKHLNSHIKKRHLNAKIKSTVGWFSVDPGAGVVNSDRKKGRTIHHCRVEGCEWKSKDKKLLKKHYDKQHPPVPPLPKVFKCEGCEHVAPNNWAHVRHISTCIHYKALQPRICGVITNKSMMKVANQHNISEATACSIMRSLGKENPTLLFEKDLCRRLRESRDSLLGWYDAHQLNVVTNRKGDKQTTSTRTSTTNISAAPTRRRTSTTRWSPWTRRSRRR